MRPAQRSSRASHDRQRKEMAAQDWGCAVGSLNNPLRSVDAKVVMCLSSVGMAGHATMEG